MSEYSTDYLGVCPICDEEENTRPSRVTKIVDYTGKTVSLRYFICNNCGTEFTVKKTIETEAVE